MHEAKAKTHTHAYSINQHHRERSLPAARNTEPPRNNLLYVSTSINTLPTARVSLSLSPSLSGTISSINFHVYVTCVSEGTVKQDCQHQTATGLVTRQKTAATNETTINTRTRLSPTAATVSQKQERDCQQSQRNTRLSTTKRPSTSAAPTPLTSVRARPSETISSTKPALSISVASWNMFSWSSGILTKLQNRDSNYSQNRQLHGQLHCQTEVYTKTLPNTTTTRKPP